MLALLQDTTEVAAASGGMGMEAKIFMAISWILVIGLNLFCFMRVMRKR